MKTEQMELCDFESTIMNRLCHVAKHNMPIQRRFELLIDTMILLKQYALEITDENYYIVSTAFCLIESLKRKRFQSQIHNNIVRENSQIVESIKEEIIKEPYIKARQMCREKR